MLHLLAAVFLQAMMTAMMLLILLSGDVERNPGPYNMGKFQWLELVPASDMKLGLLGISSPIANPSKLKNSL